MIRFFAAFAILTAFQVHAEVSFTREVAPIFRKSCNGCHRPGKEKGGLDLTTFKSAQKGGKHGVIFGGEKSGASQLVEQISGPEPDMPKDGEPLKAREVSLIKQWILEGAKDDSPVGNAKPFEPPIYKSAPVITALAFSPGNKWLAVSGFHEVVLLNTTNFAPACRLVGEAARIESFEFSPDGKLLAVAGSVPGVFGEIQIWDPAAGKLLHAYKTGYDSVYGVHWSPDASRVAFGCADKTARVLQVSDGMELVRFDQHSDWVFGAVFVDGGKQFVSASRDRSLKLVDSKTGALLDIINRDSEPIVCMAKHPLEDWIVFGSDVRPRLYKAQAKPDNINPDRDPNAIREFENFDNGVTAIAFSADGKLLASAGNSPGETRIHAVENAQRKANLRGAEGAIFALSFTPDGTRIATGGFDGRIRVYDWAREQMVTNIVPFELLAGKKVSKK